jgi:hypothetical protein
MIATQNASDSGAARLGAFHRRPTEVVAGLVNDGSALPVAAAAVREAVRRRLPVRFLQLVAGVPGTGHESSAEADEATFRAALHALHGHPRTPSTFELVIGDPATQVVARSCRAVVLVVGDHPSDERGPSLADYCRAHADCAAHAVDLDD